MAEENKATEAAAPEGKASGKANVELSSFYGIKAGMTRIFDEAGNHIPVTVIKLIPNVVTQIKTVDKDGYEAAQIGYGEKREKLITKPIKGQLSKAKTEKLVTKFAEIKVSGLDASALGQEVSIASFTANTPIDVTGVTKGKGFQGVIKRYNFSGGPASHGHTFHRGTGSIGQRATPGRVWKNKKLPGHMGDKKQTVQNLSIVEVNADKGYLLIKGSVPGSTSSFVRISKAVKKNK